MAFVLIIIGVVLLITSVRNTVTTQGNTPGLFTLLQGDFTGPNNFVFWLFSILVIGAIGYIPKLKPVSIAFLALVITVLFLKRGDTSGTGGGFFSQLVSGLNQTTTAQQTSNSIPVAQAGATLNSVLAGLVPNPSAPNFSTPAATPPFVPSAPGSVSIGNFGLGYGVS